MPITMLQFKADQLRKSPLYNLSLANKELFHSNFIAWFGNKYPELFIKLIKKILGDSDDWAKNLQPDEMRIVREYKHFDIAVFDKDKGGNLRLIIENKVKSIPTVEQLKRYEGDACNDVKLVLLSMTGQFQNKDLKPQDTNWIFVDYISLAAYLSDLLAEIDDCYHRMLVSDYCSYVSSLQHIISELVPSSIEDTFVPSEDKVKQMCVLDIHDVCGKRSAQFVCSELKARLKTSFEVVDEYKDLRPADNQVHVACGYTNAKPLIEVRFKKELNNKVDYILIQIQGNQYRHCVEFFDSSIGERIEFKGGRGYGPNDNGIRYLKENYSYVLFGDEVSDNFPRLSTLVTDGTSMKLGQRNDYCKYCNGKPSTSGYSCFVYQWVAIPDNIHISTLIDIIYNDALQLLNHSHSTIKHKV